MPSVGQINVFMPLALRSYVGRHLGALEWRTLLPGIEQCRIARDARGEASFLRCRPGKAIPAHTHAGLEAVLVLQGGFSDRNGHYAPGDIAVADGTIDHRPVADRSVECIIFVVLEAPVRLTGPFGRLVQRIFRA
jgi:putative transcriptional regulator